LDRPPLADRVAQLHDRVPERDLRVDDFPGRIGEPFLFSGAEGLLQEIDQLRRVIDHQDRCDGVVSVRYRLELASHADPSRTLESAKTIKA